MKIKINISLSFFCLIFPWSFQAQQLNWISSGESNYWKQGSIKLKKTVSLPSDLVVGDDKGTFTFEAWGTCFNELGWDALNILEAKDKQTVLERLFSPEGELRFTLGRFSMNANDYSRDWYSSDEVDGDFQLKYFNIERDKISLIPYIKAAQKYNPELSFWMSPWSPPSWMKVNNYYSVQSSKDYNKMSPDSDIILFEGNTKKEANFFPQQFTANDFLIQDPRYLRAYANYFCKFIDAYLEQGIPIKTVMYQNEAYSYTIYPGCAWTPEGTICFNTEYLAPALKEKHPDVKLYLGTINTNRFDVVDKILSDPRMPETIKGVGFQWEGGQILSSIREKYPNYRYAQTESECGWGQFDWKAAEHTFGLINHYLGNGCTQYTFWNAILCDEGKSGWGWKQNALIQVDSQKKTVTYTPEYYAVKHYSHYIIPGSRLLSWKKSGEDKKPILVFRTPENKLVIVAGNFQDKPQRLIIKLGNYYLDQIILAHSLNTFETKGKN
nr:hypothetical protein [uncultured Flavobacterium sp.]